MLDVLLDCLKVLTMEIVLEMAFWEVAAFVAAMNHKVVCLDV
jgi:hypothetical protein